MKENMTTCVPGEMLIRVYFPLISAMVPLVVPSMVTVAPVRADPVDSSRMEPVKMALPCPKTLAPEMQNTRHAHRKDFVLMYRSSLVRPLV